MARRLFLLVALSLAAILPASFLLLQNRSRSSFSTPRFSRWGSSTEVKADVHSHPVSPWLQKPEHLDQTPKGTSDNAHPAFVPPHKGPLASGLPKDVLGENGPADKPAGAHEGHIHIPEELHVSETHRVDEPARPDNLRTGSGSGNKAEGPGSSSPSYAITDTSSLHGNGGGGDDNDDDDDTIRISMVEVTGSHDEVLAALIHSFGAKKNVKLELYQRMQRFGIEDIIEQFDLGNPLPMVKHKHLFNANVTDKLPDIVVSTTCEFDTVDYERQFAELLEAGKTYLYCVVHHADRWRKQSKHSMIMLPWIMAGMAEFVTLSKHTQDYLDKKLTRWDTGNIQPKTRHLVPVFPADLSNEPAAQVKSEELAFALQGDYSSGRRDYKKIFHHLGKFLKSDEGNDLDVQLHLIGHGGHPSVSDAVIEHVNFDEGLDYLEYYGIMSRQFAILPAFASNEYLDRKASSTVPAALIAGTPIVADQALLDAYTYLPRDCVWFQNEGEEDFDVIGRVINVSPKEREEKKRKVQEANKKRVELNRAMVAGWIEEAVTKTRQNKETTEAHEPHDSFDWLQGSETLSSPTNEPSHYEKPSNMTRTAKTFVA